MTRMIARGWDRGADRRRGQLGDIGHDQGAAMAPWRRAAVCSAVAVAAAAVATGCSARSGDGSERGSIGTVTTTTAPVPGGAGSVPPIEAPTAVVGERTLADGYELVVHQVTAPAPGTEAAPAPEPGHMLMTVDVELVNRTASARDATYLRFEVVDTAGTRYSPSPAGDRPPTGWIPADVPQRGVQLYEVPIGAVGLVLTLQPDLVSGVAATVRLR